MECGPQKVDTVNSEKRQSLGKVIQEGFLEEEEVIVLSNGGVNSLRSISQRCKHPSSPSPPVLEESKPVQ